MQERKKPGPPRLPAEQRTKPRSIRLNESRWLKLKNLGTRWLEQAIDSAKEPA